MVSLFNKAFLHTKVMLLTFHQKHCSHACYIQIQSYSLACSHWNIPHIFIGWLARVKTEVSNSRKKKKKQTTVTNISNCLTRYWVFLSGFPPADAGDGDLIPASGRSLEKEMATHCSILAWKVPWRMEPGGLPSMG